MPEPGTTRYKRLQLLIGLGAVVVALGAIVVLRTMGVTADSAPTVERAAAADLGPISFSEPVQTGLGIEPTAAHIHRDCGFSAVMHDGNSLRVWCDSLVWNEEEEEPNRDAGMEWFRESSWSVSESGDPYTTTENEAEAIFPDDESLCTRGQVSWPQSLSVVERHVDSTRLLVLVDTECGPPPSETEHRDVVGTGVAELVYRDEQLELVDVDYVAFAHNEYSAIFTWDADDWVYLFACPDSEPCRLARTTEETITDRDSHEWWTGYGWTPSRLSARLLWSADFLDAENPLRGDVNVTHIPQVDRVVVGYTTFPGFGPMMFRVAPTPWGPWTKGTDPFTPDGCDGVRCYDFIPHEDLSGDDYLGFTYHGYWIGNHEIIIDLE